MGPIRGYIKPRTINLFQCMRPRTNGTRLSGGFILVYIIPFVAKATRLLRVFFNVFVVLLAAHCHFDDRVLARLMVRMNLEGPYAVFLLPSELFSSIARSVASFLTMCFFAAGTDLQDKLRNARIGLDGLGPGLGVRPGRIGGLDIAGNELQRRWLSDCRTFDRRSPAGPAAGVAAGPGAAGRRSSSRSPAPERRRGDDSARAQRRWSNNGARNGRNNGGSSRPGGRSEAAAGPAPTIVTLVASGSAPASAWTARSRAC